jgi:hypothetical protein
MPTKAPDVHVRGKSRRPARTLKGDLKALGGKLSSAGTAWVDGREKGEAKKRAVREDAEKILTPVKEKIEEEKKLAKAVMKPVHGAIEMVKTNLDPGSGKTRPYVTSFLFSSIASWLISPQILVAGYERMRFGTSATSWGLLNGPGRWFRDTVGMAYESGRLGTLIWAAALGLFPMFIMLIRNVTANHLAQSPYRGRLGMLGIKWLTRLAYLVPLGYLVGISYPAQVAFFFGSPWTLQWWQFWVSGLFCATFYCTMWVFDRIEKGLGLGYTHVLLMTPLASIITGALLYAPGAAW